MLNTLAQLQQPFMFFLSSCTDFVASHNLWLAVTHNMARHCLTHSVFKLAQSKEDNMGFLCSETMSGVTYTLDPTYFKRLFVRRCSLNSCVQPSNRVKVSKDTERSDSSASDNDGRHRQAMNNLKDEGMAQSSLASLPRSSSADLFSYLPSNSPGNVSQVSASAPPQWCLPTFIPPQQLKNRKENRTRQIEGRQ